MILSYGKSSQSLDSFQTLSVEKTRIGVVLKGNDSKEAA